MPMIKRSKTESGAIEAQDPKKGTNSNIVVPSLVALYSPLAGYSTEISAATSGIVTTTIGFPFDSIKTRIQTYKYDSYAACVRQTYAIEGLSGFFRGVAMPLTSVTMFRTLSFSVFDRMRPVFANLFHIKNFNDGPLWSYWTTTFSAGMTSGAVISFFGCPFEMTKLRSQVSI